MEYKKFLGLPILETVPGPWALLANYLSRILFIGIGFILMGMLLGTINEDIWYYLDDIPRTTELILPFILGIIFSWTARYFLNKHVLFFWIKPKWDIIFYILFFIVLALVKSE